MSNPHVPFHVWLIQGRTETSPIMFGLRADHEALHHTYNLGCNGHASVCSNWHSHLPSGSVMYPLTSA